MGKIVIAADVGGTSVKFGAFNENGSLFKKWQINTDHSQNGNFILPHIGASIKDTCDRLGISNEDVLGIGLGVPGAVLPDGLVNKCVNLGWDKRYAARELELITGIPVKAANDANLSALGEHYCGAAKDHDDVLLITMGTGIGGGIISGGRLITGAFGSAGEIGHIHVNDDETTPCNCGACGCLEQYATVNGFVRTATQMLHVFSTPSKLRDLNDEGPGFTTKDVFDLAKDGDSIANLAVNVGCSYLGRAAAVISNIFNPSIILIGGGISAAGQIIIDRMMPDFEKYLFHACRGVKIDIAALGNDAGIWGASRLVLDSWHKEGPDER